MGRCQNDAAWRLVKPFPEADAARIRYLSLAEIPRPLNGSSREFRPMVQAGLLTGARYAEVCALTVADFNPDAGSVAIRTSKARKPRHVVLTREGMAFFTRACAGRPGNEIMFLRPDSER